jgi:hypothetical protein
MSISRRTALAGGAAAAASIGTRARGAQGASVPAINVTPPTAWSGDDLNAFCRELADQVIAIVQNAVPEDEQRTVLTGTASHLLKVGLDLPGEGLAERYEPRGSIAGMVLEQYMSMRSMRDLHDATNPSATYEIYVQDCVAAAHATNKHPAVLDLTNSSIDFATEMGYIGCRIGAHLAIANMNAFGNHHASEQMRFRKKLAERDRRFDQWVIGPPTG